MPDLCAKRRVWPSTRPRQPSCDIVIEGKRGLDTFASTIVILAFAHHKRDPDYWRSRK